MKVATGTYIGTQENPHMVALEDLEQVGFDEEHNIIYAVLPTDRRGFDETIPEGNVLKVDYDQTGKVNMILVKATPLEGKIIEPEEKG